MTAFHPLATFLPSGGNNEAGQLETSIRIVECLLSLFPCQKRAAGSFSGHKSVARHERVEVHSRRKAAVVDAGNRLGAIS
ncbi:MULTISPECIES: hypothetical protein [unclassified Rhizobium]|jgi:hypothetical protein|uniref:hypothetical protein n=1 Tax=unclassified Rhizobium TaxID=2613769 RepID=UPI00036EB9C7|nr:MULTISPECIES: hypothetical protein [unclassified Rhizobium]MBD9448447.1 hypothetical protein [Rhizobium sp. RHZ01]MBD9455102.1 hypothetical protein [Rhizobium sp. RHZ02]